MYNETSGGSSSSSSLGWSDEYEGSTTKKVYEELKRMNSVLRGEEVLPPHYDKEEYEQWMKTFPNISIFDFSETPVNSIRDITEKLSKEPSDFFIYGIGTSSVSKYDCDINTSNRLSRRKTTVMRISEISPSRLLNQRGLYQLPHDKHVRYFLQYR
ncbi:hypothetical protein JTB14_025657 [Gonioctena quinquepunctata]|nr:hypothetical protein JTB14_025657 [Gonioctena quinquepunctata]